MVSVALRQFFFDHGFSNSNITITAEVMTEYFSRKCCEGLIYLAMMNVINYALLFAFYLVLPGIMKR